MTESPYCSVTVVKVNVVPDIDVVTNPAFEDEAVNV